VDEADLDAEPTGTARPVLHVDGGDDRAVVPSAGLEDPDRHGIGAAAHGGDGDRRGHRLGRLRLGDRDGGGGPLRRGRGGLGGGRRLGRGGSVGGGGGVGGRRTGGADLGGGWRGDLIVAAPVAEEDGDRREGDGHDGH